MTEPAPRQGRSAGVPTSVLAALDEARRAEKAQTRFYRTLAALAEAAGDTATAERLNGLHADEQHHLSRLTARLLEFGHAYSGEDPVPHDIRFEEWESVARQRERGEIARYERLLAAELDPRTREMIDQFLEAERRHEAELGGKWMSA
jgi:rubrerythrin